MISYAQNQEDVFLNRLFKDVERGFYVDVGAADPVFCSVTKHFYDLGWSGINLEPGGAFEKLAAQRPRDLNLKICAGQESRMITFYERPSHPELSSKIEQMAVEIDGSSPVTVAVQVPQEPLSVILDRHAKGREIHFMKIDVEGAEEEVIASADWRRHRPVALLVEATVPFTQIPSHERWEKILISHDYLFAYFDGLNRFYVREESRDLLKHFAVPVNSFDNAVPCALPDQQEKARILQDKFTAATSRLARQKDALDNMKIEAAGLKSSLKETRRLLRDAIERCRSPGAPWSVRAGQKLARFLRRFESSSQREAKIAELIKNKSGEQN